MTSTDKKTKLLALKTLRERTKAGIMDCNNALKEAKGKIETAIDILYIQIKKKAEKLSKNPTPQNFIFGNTNKEGNCGVLIQLACQTDFVGSNEDFSQLAKDIVTLAIKEKPKTISELQDMKIGNKTIQEQINFWIAAFGENIVLYDYQKLQGEAITSFIHTNKRSGSLVESNITEATKKPNSPAQKIAMQIALKKPMGITEKNVIDILQAGGKKIPNIERIVVGKALLSQPFLQEEKTVTAYLAENDPNLIIKRFVRAPQAKASKK